MPIDASIPLQGQTPNTLANIGSVVGTAQGLQALQTGQIQQQRLGINLQAEQQANQERQAVVAAIQSKDPDLTPGPDGIVDQGRATAKLQQLAPQTYNSYLRALGQSLTKDLGDTLQPALGGPIKGKLEAAQDWMDRNSNVPMAQKIGKQFIQGLGTVKSKQDGGDDGDAITLAAAKRANTISEQIAASTPGVGLVQEGAQIQPRVTASNLSGLPLMSKVGEPIPMSIPPGYMTDASGKLVKVGGVNNQGAPAPAPAPSLPPLKAGLPPGPAPQTPAFMDKQQAQTASDAQARWSAAQTRDVDPSSGYNATAQVYSNLKNLLDKNPNLGPGSAGANQFMGRISTLTGHKIGDLNSAYQEAIGYFDRLSAQNSAATGAATNFAREQQASATGNPEVMGPTALQEKLRFGASVNEAGHAYTQASSNYKQRYGQAAYAQPEMFENAWSANANPLAFRLMAAQKNGDTADFKATQERVAGLPLPQQQAIHQQYLNLRDYLLKGLVPPNGQ